MGYHKRDIKRGTYGDFSKIQEEWEELADAREQGAKLLELCELSDLYGAIAGYVEKHFGLTIEDIKQMSELTSSAFRDGERK